jgi:hypothetical protein
MYLLRVFKSKTVNEIFNIKKTSKRKNIINSKENAKGKNQSKHARQIQTHLTLTMMYITIVLQFF